MTGQPLPPAEQAARVAAARLRNLNLDEPAVYITARRVSRFELTAARWGRYAGRTVAVPAVALVVTAAAGGGPGVALPLAGGVWLAAGILVAQVPRIIRRRFTP